MRYRRLGKTGLQVSEIGFGGEWLERHPEAEGIELIHHAAAQGINILDCWMADPTSRDIIGKGIRDNRSHWYIQGHIGSTWKDGQYFRSRDIQYVRPAFEDLLQRLQTDYIDPLCGLRAGLGPDPALGLSGLHHGPQKGRCHPPYWHQLP